jgi:hypothetical protein
VEERPWSKAVQKHRQIAEGRDSALSEPEYPGEFAQVLEKAGSDLTGIATWRFRNEMRR